jgi:hypothetical protein
MKFSRRTLLASAAGGLALSLSSKSSDALLRGHSPNTNLQTMKIGAGGWVTQIYAADDGTIICKTDTAGAYVWNATTSVWHSIVTPSSMPGQPAGRYYSQGIFECAIAPSNSNKIFLFYYENLYVIINKGENFSLTKYPTFSSPLQGQSDVQKHRSQHMAVDPLDENTVYASDVNNIYVSHDSGTNFTKLNDGSTIPSATNSGGYSIVFDRTSSPVGGRTGTVYISSWGNQIYKSTDAGATWAAMRAGPTAVTRFAIGSDSTVWALSGSTTTSFVWKCVDEKWSQLTFASMGLSARPVALWSLDIAPGASRPVVVINEEGQLNVFNGSTWTGPLNFTRASGDVPWLAVTALNFNFMECSCVMFDPVVPNKLWMTNGIGVFTTTVPNASFVWTPITAGIENLTTNVVTSSPSYPGKAFTGVWDKSIFVISDPDVYQSTCLVNRHFLNDCWELAYASSDPSYIFGLITKNGFLIDDSGYTNDGGATWTYFPTAPLYFILTTNAPSSIGDTVLHFASPIAHAIYPAQGVRVNGTGTTIGHVAALASGGDVTIDTPLAARISAGTDMLFYSAPSGCLAATTPKNIVLCPEAAAYPLYTKDGGKTWRIIDLSSFGVPTGGFVAGNGWGTQAFHRNHFIAADSRDGTFYLYNHTTASKTWNGIYTATDPAGPWTRQLSGPIPFSLGPYTDLLKTPPYFSGGYDTAGHVFYCDGRGTSASSFLFSTNHGLNWNKITGNAGGVLQNILAYGFGAAAPGGNGYPTIYILGQVNGTWGYWRGDNFQSTVAPYSATWTRLATYANNSLSPAIYITGDATSYGKFYVAFDGNGYAYGVL